MLLRLFDLVSIDNKISLVVMMYLGLDKCLFMIIKSYTVLGGEIFLSVL